MENPFQILGISETTTEAEVVQALEERLNQLESIAKDNQRFFVESTKRGVVFAGNTRIWERDSIEEDLAEKFACGVNPTSKFMGYEELSQVAQKVDEERKTNPAEKSNLKFLHNMLIGHTQRSIRAVSEYKKVLNGFKSNSSSSQARTSLQDLYIKMKYEDAVSNLGTELASKLQTTSQPIQDKSAFLRALSTDSRYMQIHSAYESIATDRSRTDLVPDLFIKSRLGNASLLTVANPEWKENVVKRERQYTEDFIEQEVENAYVSNRERFQKGIAENQNHDYSWGVILDKPRYLMKGVLVNNSDFSGRISVKHMGYFTSESLFSKRQLLREKHENTKVYMQDVDIEGKRLRLAIREHVPNPSIPEHMRDYYYKHESTTQLYNNLYIVTKTDSTGVQKDSLVFSPVSKEQMGQIPQEFLSEVYFSDYALDIANQNGGFAGTIVNTPKGLSISTAYNQEEIASGVLFQNRTRVKILDRTIEGNKNWRSCSSSEVEALLFVNNLEREMSKDE